MVTVTLRIADEKIEKQLNDRASANGRSIEAEATEILCHALAQARETAEPPRQYKSDLVRRIREIVDPVGGIDLELPPRGPGREPPRFE